MTRLINSVVFCNKFRFKQQVPSDAPQPQVGRVYESHYDVNKGQYSIQINGTPQTTSMIYTFDGDNGENDAWEYEFTEVTNRNVADLPLVDEDMDVIERFMTERKGKVSLDETLPYVGIVDEVEEIDETLDQMEPTDEEIRQAEESINEILGLESEKARRIQDAVQAMNLMIKKDPGLARSVQETMIHVGACLADKYYNTPIDTTKFLYDKVNGKGFNIGNATKYLSRYMTEGYEKSGKVQDLYKAIHYCLFEITRLNMNK